MDQKAADELVGIERHKLVASVGLGPVILAFEGHALTVEGSKATSRLLVIAIRWV
jgi:hypothetical protein